MTSFTLDCATEADVPVLLTMIRGEVRNVVNARVKVVA
jgi:hypothetical protein